ncbi:MAG: hypothetical protein P8Q14_07375 [Vicingaceae bacterium]|nr:hypothetical protein [Vicingaceae bacterium]
MKSSTKITLLKTVLVLLMLAIIYLSLGFIAGIGVIVMEVMTHKMSKEIGGDFNPWIIYVGLGVYLFTIRGMLLGCGIGYYKLRVRIRRLTK